MVHQRVDKTDIRRLGRLGSPTANMVSLPASAAGKLPPTTVTATATVAAEARPAYGRCHLLWATRVRDDSLRLGHR